MVTDASVRRKHPSQFICELTRCRNWRAPKQHVPLSGSGPSMFATTTSSPIDSAGVEAKLSCWASSSERGPKSGTSRDSGGDGYTDQYGNTTGWVGSKYISTYSDGYGGMTGTIGNKLISTYEDGYGNTRGTIGRDRINLYTDPSGTTIGTIGRRRLKCYTDRFRTTTCN